MVLSVATFLPQIQQITNSFKASYFSMSIVENTRLFSEDVLLNVSAFHISQCIKKCSETNPCTSFNVLSEKVSASTYLCQLLPLNKYADRKRLESNYGWMHFSMLVSF